MTRAPHESGEVVEASIQTDSGVDRSRRSQVRWFLAKRRVSILLVGRKDLVGVREAPRPGDVDRHYADISKARRLLDFEPRTSLDEGLEQTLAWFRSEEIAETLDREAAGRPNW